MKLITRIENIIEAMPDGQEFLTRDIANATNKPSSCICDSLRRLEEKGIIRVRQGQQINRIWIKGTSEITKAWNRFVRMKL